MTLWHRHDPNPPRCICGELISFLPQGHVCVIPGAKPPPTEDQRGLALHDLRYLLSFPRLGEWGMDTLKDTLAVLLPELNNKDTNV